ncbi:MAG: divergent polysaccharide deacetylase family protein [Pseudomonadota bacterium]
MTSPAALSTFPAYWRSSGTAGRLLIILSAICLTAVAFGATLIAILPKQETPVRISPQFAKLQTGPVRLPVNLPSPAAGAGLKIPLNVKNLKAAAEKDAAKTAAPEALSPSENEIASAAAAPAPHSRTPRRPLAKYFALSGDLALPIVASDGTTAFDYYKSPPAPEITEDKARIALIVTGMGLNTARSEAALEVLPSAVTIAVSPYAQDPQRWINKALDQNRDALIMVPMEPNSFPSVDPGPDTLMRDAPEVQTLERLHRVLGKAQGYIGIVNDTGSRFTANAIALAPVLDDLSQRGLMVLDARASAYSVLAAEAAKRNIPVAINTRFVDSSLTPEDIQRQLRDLERTAQTLGVAVGVVRALPVSMDQVMQWQSTLNDAEIVLAPISNIANQQPVR